MNLHEIKPSITQAEKIGVAISVLNGYEDKHYYISRQLPNGVYQYKRRTDPDNYWIALDNYTATYWITEFDQNKLTP